MGSLEQEGVLFTIAQIAITIIGLSGIVLFLGERTKLKLSKTEHIRIFSLISTPLLALFASFFPILLFEVLRDQNTAWHLSNGILATLHLYPITSWVLTTGGHKTLGNWTTVGLGYMTILAHYLAAFGVLPWKEAVYIYGLLWLIFIGVYSFLQLFQLEDK